MKSLIVKNVKEIQGKTNAENGNEFTVKTIIPEEEVSKCRVNFVEVDPGNYAYGYHYHEVNEEVFYVISGQGAVRTKNGEIMLKAGDVIAFPTGIKGAHIMRNPSETEKLVYIDFGTAANPEIVHLLDIKKIMVSGMESTGIFDEFA